LTSTSSSPSYSSASSTTNSSGGSLSIAWNYVGMVAINAAVFIMVGAFVATKRKNVRRGDGPHPYGRRP
jgi:hypothetical protein